MRLVHIRRGRGPLTLYLSIEEIQATRPNWSVRYIRKLAHRDKWRRIRVNRRAKYFADDVTKTLHPDTPSERT